MKLIAQAGVVCAICWISLCIEQVLPFAMPASIIGMLLLLLLLTLRLVKLDWVQDLADVLLGNLQFLFVPALVSIVQYLDVLRESWAAIVIVCVVTTFVTFAAAVWAVRLTLRWMERSRK